MRIDKKSITENSGQSTSGWLTTFNDLVTLLMVFFVLVFATSSIDTGKISTLKNFLQSGLGIFPEGKQFGTPEDKISVVNDKLHFSARKRESFSEKDEIVREIEDFIVDADLFQDVKVTYIESGISFSLANHILFGTGSAVLNPAGAAVFDRIAAIIRTAPCPVRIEGHTDNVPINTALFPSNWELSTARALYVVKYLIRMGRIEPQRFSAVGYGESKSVFPNDTPEHRAGNRRVEIVMETER